MCVCVCVCVCVCGLKWQVTGEMSLLHNAGGLSLSLSEEEEEEREGGKGRGCRWRRSRKGARGERGVTTMKMSSTFAVVYHDVSVTAAEKYFLATPFN